DRAEPADIAKLLLPADQTRQLVAAVVQRVNRVFGDDGEQREIDRVNAFAEQIALSAALAGDKIAAGLSQRPADKRERILKVIAIDDARQSLSRSQRLAVARVHVAHFPLRDRDQRHLVNPILPAPKPQMQPAAQDVALV